MVRLKAFCRYLNGFAHLGFNFQLSLRFFRMRSSELNNKLFPLSLCCIVCQDKFILAQISTSHFLHLSSDTVRVSFGSCSVKWGFYRRFTEHDPNNIRTKPLFCSRCSFLLQDCIPTVTEPLRATTGKRRPTSGRPLILEFLLPAFNDTGILAPFSIELAGRS